MPTVGSDPALGSPSKQIISELRLSFPVETGERLHHHENHETKTKSKTTLGVARHLFSRVACLGAAILICSSAAAENLFVSGSYAGQTAQTGVIFEITPDGAQSTFALGLSDPIGLAFDSAGNLFVAESGSGSILKFTPGAVRTTFASGLSGPVGLAFDRAGNLFVTDGDDIVGPGHANIYKVTPSGHITVFTRGLTAILGVVFDGRDRMYVLETSTAAGDPTPFTGKVIRVDPSGHQTEIASGLFFPTGITFGPDGALYVSNVGFGPPPVGMGEILRITVP